MFETQANNISLGYKKICNLSGLTDGEGRKIKDYLEHMGVIKTIDGQTVIVGENPFN